jgi:hypothetical protein
MTQSPVVRALVEEATRKSGLIWVRTAGPARPLWHIWHGGAAYVVGGGPQEQPLSGLADGAAAEVTVPSRDKRGRVVAWTADVAELPPHSEAWEEAVPLLRAKRLNTKDDAAATERWARECRVLRLTPVSATTDHPSDSLAAPPLPTPAATSGTPERRGRRRRPWRRAGRGSA